MSLSVRFTMVFGALVVATPAFGADSFMCKFEQKRRDGGSAVRRGDLGLGLGDQTLNLRGFGVFDASASFVAQKPRVAVRICKRGDRCEFKIAEAGNGALEVAWPGADANGATYRLTCTPNALTATARACVFYGETYGFSGVHYGGDGELNLPWVHGFYADVKAKAGRFTLSICKTAADCTTKTLAADGALAVQRFIDVRGDDENPTAKRRIPLSLECAQP